MRSPASTRCRGPTCTPSRTTPTWRRTWRRIRPRARWSTSPRCSSSSSRRSRGGSPSICGRGTPLPDPVLALLGPDAGADRTRPQRLALLRACLRAHRQHMIERFGPYLELATIAETLGTPERIAYASDQFIHDLAVWYHLAWLGETVRRTRSAGGAPHRARPRVHAPAQRRELLDAHRRARGAGGAALPRARRARRSRAVGDPVRATRSSRCCSTSRARATRCPAWRCRSTRPTPAARRAPRWHVEEAVRVFTRAFGAPPAGCWPSEGAISAATLELLGRAGGFRWAASSSRGAARQPRAHRPAGGRRPARLQPALPPAPAPA